MQIRYVVTPYSVRYLTICSMSIALIRKQNIFGILLSSNTLLKTSLDKGCYQKLLSLGDDRRQAHKNSDKQIPQIA